MLSFNSVEEIIELAEKNGKTISQVVIEQQAIEMEKTEEEIYDKMKQSYLVMKESIEKGLEKDITYMSGIKGEMGARVKHYVESGANFSGGFMGEIIYSALAVSEINACMGRVVAAPTAGSCGIIPACLITLQKHQNIPEEKIIMGLINASAIGMVIAKRATISGAEGGCQAECGSASSMAASAIVEIMGGTPTMCGHGAAQALKSQLGLICDPVAGLVEEPCIIRNVSSASIAISAAEMSLAGISSIIPIDEVIIAMGIVGKQLPVSLRETSGGGLAVTPTGREIAKEMKSRLSGQ